MKLIAYILMAFATMAGSIAAATAYLVPIQSGAVDDATLTRITLAAPAGAFDPTTEQGAALLAHLNEIRAEQRAAREAERPEPLIEPTTITVDTPPLPEVDAAPTGSQIVSARGRLAPIARAGDDLTPELLEILRANGVENVKSKAFKPGVWLTTWPSWVFIGSMLVLFGSAMMVRAASRAAGRAAMAASELEATSPDALPSDAGALARMIQMQVEGVVAEVDTLPSEREQLALIVDRLGEVQKTLIPAFAAARPAIIAKMGMGGYAQVMDAFAASERRINRAWSAAADGHEEEALTSLRAADEVLPSLVERLRG
ncbi:MAG: hypothetical protein Tsb0013_19940 [Phycisphaerales bacterium]